MTDASVNSSAQIGHRQAAVCTTAPIHQVGLLGLLFKMIMIIGVATATAQSVDKPVKIIAFGDSLTAGYQLRASDAFPAQLERALKGKGLNVTVVNAGVSGDTTAAGLARLKWAIDTTADAVIVEFGANDALRALDPGQARANLDKILTTIRANRSEILLAGMRAPNNLGPTYVKAFNPIFPDLATKHDVLLYDFFLDRVVMKPELNLSDGIHPNARGVAEIVTGILPKAEALVERVQKKRLASRS